MNVFVFAVFVVVIFTCVCAFHHSNSNIHLWKSLLLFTMKIIVYESNYVYKFVFYFCPRSLSFCLSRIKTTIKTTLLYSIFLTLVGTKWQQICCHTPPSLPSFPSLLLPFSFLLSPSPLLSCLILSCLVLSCPVLSCLVLPCRVVSCHVLSCLVVSCRVVSCRVLSCRIVSCRGIANKINSERCGIICNTVLRWQTNNAQYKCDCMQCQNFKKLNNGKCDLNNRKAIVWIVKFL